MDTKGSPRITVPKSQQKKLIMAPKKVSSSRKSTVLKNRTKAKKTIRLILNITKGSPCITVPKSQQKKLIMAPNKVSSSRKSTVLKNRTKAKKTIRLILNGKRVTLVQMAVAALSYRRKHHGQDDETLPTTRDLVFKMCGWTNRNSFNVTMAIEANKLNALICFPDSKTMDLTAAGIAVAPQESFQGIITSNNERQDLLQESFLIGGKARIMPPNSVTDYVEDMYEHFFRKEEGTSVNRCYMSPPVHGVNHGIGKLQPHINENMRCIVVDWLIEVHYKFKLFPETLYLTANILDRFLSETDESVTTCDLQLVGVTSLLISAKYEERFVFVPGLQDLTYICDGDYTEAKILRMEENILRTLEYNVTVPTPHIFLVRFLKGAHACKLTQQIANFVLDGTLLSLEHLTCLLRPSQMAAAAVMIARRATGRLNWSPTLVAYSQYDEEEVIRYAQMVLKAKSKLDKNKELMALQKKYSKKKYGKVSHYKFAPIMIIKQGFFYHYNNSVRQCEARRMNK